MALAGAIATLEWLHRQWKYAQVRYVSDSEYLVKGVTEWLPGWKARGWKRKGGEIENLLLWQKLDQARQGLDIHWGWLRGHNDVPKNEYADFLAVRAAEQQERSNGLVPSGFDTWLAQQRARGSTPATIRTERCMSAPKDGVAANTHPLNLMADGAVPPPVERIPLYEVYMRMAEELAKRSTCVRLQVGTVVTTSCSRTCWPSAITATPGTRQSVRQRGAGQLRLHSLGDERAASRHGERARQGGLRQRVSVCDVRQADHQLRRHTRVLSQGVP